MIGVAVPAHDEERRLEACLASIANAAAHPALGRERVVVVVALDACSDGSAAIAAAHRCRTVSLQARNVGRARAAAAEALLVAGARWLAFTDADTVVAGDWLAQQLALGADAVCGTVGVIDWHGHPHGLPARHRAAYEDVDGHRHVHGANLGVSAEAYRRAGGVPALPVHEDVALVARLERSGARIAWSARPRVLTSARLDPRARGGFGDALRALSPQVPDRPAGADLADRACAAPSPEIRTLRRLQRDGHGTASDRDAPFTPRRCPR